MSISLIFASLFISFVLTSILVPFFKKIARRFEILDIPGGLKKHKESTPYLGGLAVFLGFFLTSVLVIRINNEIGLLFIGLIFLLFLGLIDDLYKISPLQKFLGQIIITFFFLVSGFYLKTSFINNFFEEKFAYYLNIFISGFWILSIINAFNLIDVMDGLTSTVSIFATLSFLIFSILLNKYLCALVFASFLGALLAFFFFNKPKANIFLGDAGSLFIGGFFAVFPFFINFSFYHSYGIVIPVFILLIPILEITLLIFIRIYKGIPFYLGSPDHFSIYLQNKLWSKYCILSYVALFSLLQLISTLLLLFDIIDFKFFIMLQIVFIGVWIFNLFYKTPKK